MEVEYWQSGNLFLISLSGCNWWDALDYKQRKEAVQRLHAIATYKVLEIYNNDILIRKFNREKRNVYTFFEDFNHITLAERDAETLRCYLPLTGGKIRFYTFDSKAAGW